ncbi:MAG: glycosyltransferase [Acetobacteraceae bacterium]|nr:glycosyltransferase [Acetobacteraceae bacterium]
MTEALLTAATPMLVVVALGALLLPLVRPDHPAFRALGALACGLLMLRYLVWRATETIPAGDGIGVWIAWTFLTVELLSCVAGLLLLHVLSRTRDRSAEADAHPVERHPGGPPLIDVLIPTYNEAREILERTIVGAMAQDYPRFRVWILDDKRRPWLRELAEIHGAGYLTRPDNSHGKAGNMNAALRRIMALPEAPDAIAVLDADFVAAPQFLRRGAALLHDPRVALVQTPQRFFNPDPIQLNLGDARTVPDEQRFFFDVIMPSKDAHGTAFSCGTSAIIRCSALREVGLFPTESVTEDLLLSLKLKEAGWTSVYLNEPLSIGLAPEGMGEYLTQRGRWCLGTMQIMRTRWAPWARSRMPLVMRLHTVDTFLFWSVGSLIRILSLLIPVLYWWFGLVVMQTGIEDLLWYFGPYWIGFALFLAKVSRGTNLPVLAESMSLLVSPVALRATAVGLFGRRDQKFKVTDKGTTRDRVVVHWGLVAPFLGVAAATAGGVAWRLAQGPVAYTPADVEAMNLFWSLYNILILAIAALLCVEPPRFRAQERFDTTEAAPVEWGPWRHVARITDMSLTGCRVELPPEAAPPVPGAMVRLVIPEVGPAQAEVRRVNGERSLGLRFMDRPGLRTALICKLLGGGYARPVESMRSRDFARLVLRRLFA